MLKRLQYFLYIFSVSKMTTDIPNVTPILPEADFPGEKPDKPEVIRSGVGKYFVLKICICVLLLRYVFSVIQIKNKEDNSNLDRILTPYFTF